MNWKIIDFNKIPGETPFNTYFDALNRYKFNQIINYNKDIFFLLGDDSEENPDNTNSIIYRSLDFGTTFHKTTLGKGTISEACFAGKNLFVVLENRDFIDGASRVSSSLFISKDFGETWEKVKDFDGENLYDINFYSENVGIACLYGSRIRYLFTKNGGKSWEEFAPQSDQFDLGHIFQSEDNILFVDNNNFRGHNLTTYQIVLINFICCNHSFY